MAKQNEHGKIIAAAAKAALVPLGCKRIGQSRCWISDERSWVIFIEFEPSGWEKGTYLKIRPRWLWLRWGHGNTDMKDRVGNFIPFKSVEQFTPLVEDLAAQATARVIELRGQFETLSDVHSFFMSRVTAEGYPIYRAAIASALMGDFETAEQLLDRLKRWPPFGFEWQTRLKSEARALAKLMHEPPRFLAAIGSTVKKLRRELGLPPDLQCLEALVSKRASG
jgi:hypothetical protein